MFEHSAAYYDLIYQSKDYHGEAQKLSSRIPDGARTLLDVGCGTGQHHRYLTDRLAIHGLDLNLTLLGLARAKNPRAEYDEGDMREFATGRKYDVVTSLFSAVGYCLTLEDLTATLQTMAAHLAEDGLLFLEPWLEPQVWTPGRIFSDLSGDDTVQVCRMSESRLEGRVSVVDFHYLVGEPGKGVTSFRETHRLGLFSREEMLTAFERAGLIVTFDEVGLSGRGLCTARHSS